MTRFVVALTTLFTERVEAVRSGSRERGATAVEYGLIVALIAAVIVVIVATLGDQINDAFTTVSDEIEG